MSERTGKGHQPNEKSYILETQSKPSVIQKNDGKPGETKVDVTTPSSISSTDDMGQLVEQDDGGAQTQNSMAHASFNYINSILGSGVIGMPYALHQAGVLSGIILMFVVAIITDYSLVLMIRAGRLSGSYSYQGMMEAAFGRWGFYVLSALQFIYPIIAMISYNIIAGDTLTKVLMYFTSELQIHRGATVLTVTALITLPLSLYRDVTKMAKISFLSLVSIFLIMISILIRFGSMDIPLQDDSWRLFNPAGMMQATGVFSFAFMCHHNTFLIYKSMKNATEEKWKRVTHISIGTALVICLIFAVGGYGTFTSLVQGDLLENYCWNDVLINVSRILFCLTILLTFPLECLVARDVIENLFFANQQPSSTSRHFSVTVLIILAAFIVSISTDCLGIVLELNGILTAIPLAYVLPAMCYLRLEPTSLLSKEKLPALTVVSFGCLVSFTGLVLLLLREREENTCSHGRSMPYCYNDTSSWETWDHWMTQPSQITYNSTM